jgi:hypothetical protein
LTAQFSTNRVHRDVVEISFFFLIAFCGECDPARNTRILPIAPALSAALKP